jgi:hypothetical protein
MGSRIDQLNSERAEAAARWDCAYRNDDLDGMEEAMTVLRAIASEILAVLARA